MDPFRHKDGVEVLEAPSRSGLLKIELAPAHATLSLPDYRVTIAQGFVTIASRRKRQESRKLAGFIAIARDIPHEDIGIWVEVEHGIAARIFGVEPATLIAEDGLANLRSFDRVSRRLRHHLLERAPGVARCYEVGRGADKALLLDRGDSLELFVRPLFRGIARRVLEVHADGRIRVMTGDRSAEVKCRSRFQVTLLGDYIRFADPTGLDLARVPVRWISREDREELARRIGVMIETGVAPGSEKPTIGAGMEV